MTTRPQPVTCRPSDAQRVFGFSRATLYRWANAGHFRIYRGTGMSFVVVDDVLSYIRSVGD